MTQSDKKYMEEQFARIKHLKTTELLDWELDEEHKGNEVLETEIYFDAHRGVHQEIMKRWPFEDLDRQIDELTRQNEGMQKAIDKLKRHKHDSYDGSVMGPI